MHFLFPLSPSFPLPSLATNPPQILIVALLTLKTLFLPPFWLCIFCVLPFVSYSLSNYSCLFPLSLSSTNIYSSLFLLHPFYLTPSLHLSPLAFSLLSVSPYFISLSSSTSFLLTPLFFHPPQPLSLLLLEIFPSSIRVILSSDWAQRHPKDTPSCCTTVICLAMIEKGKDTLGIVWKVGGMGKNVLGGNFFFILSRERDMNGTSGARQGNSWDFHLGSSYGSSPFNVEATCSSHEEKQHIQLPQYNPCISPNNFQLEGTNSIGNHHQCNPNTTAYMGEWKIHLLSCKKQRLSLHQLFRVSLSLQ